VNKIENPNNNMLQIQQNKPLRTHIIVYVSSVIPCHCNSCILIKSCCLYISSFTTFQRFHILLYSK